MKIKTLERKQAAMKAKGTAKRSRNERAKEVHYFTLRMKKEHYKQLKVKSRATLRSLNFLINKAIEDMLKPKRRKTNIKAPGEPNIIRKRG